MKNIEENFDLVVDLWKNFNLASSMFTRAIGGTSNEVGEFAELLIAKYYKGIKLPASNKSSDIELKDGRKVQVKARKIKSLDVIATKLGVFRSWDFDILVIILFDINGSIIKAIEIDSRTAYQLAKDDQHQNGMSLTTNNELLNHKNAKDITKDLQNMIENKTITSANYIEKQKKETSCSYLNSYQSEKVGQIAQRSLQYNTNIKQIIINDIKIDIYPQEKESVQDFVKRTFTKLITNNLLREDVLKKLFDKYYCKDNFGIQYALLQTDWTKCIDNAGYERYWKTFKIDNKYFCCSQWWKELENNYIDKLADWLNTAGIYRK